MLTLQYEPCGIAVQERAFCSARSAHLIPDDSSRGTGRRHVFVAHPLEPVHQPAVLTAILPHLTQLCLPKYLVDTARRAPAHRRAIDQLGGCESLVALRRRGRPGDDGPGSHQWLASLAFWRDSWSTKRDARRVTPSEYGNAVVVEQIKVLVVWLPASEGAPLLDFNAEEDSTQLTREQDPRVACRGWTSRFRTR